MMPLCDRPHWHPYRVPRDQADAHSISWGPRRDPHSTKRIFGVFLVLAVLLLFFTASAFWLVLVAGFYLFRVLRTPPAKTSDPPQPQRIDPGGGFDSDDVRKALDRQIPTISGRIPPDLLEKVQSIRQIILGILPRAGVLPPGSPELFAVERTATDYLPTALESYLNLPTTYATLHPVKDGKTAKQVLMDQLTLLESKMYEVADTVHRNDTDRLLANGRFLEDRFGRSDLSLPGPAPGP